MGSQSGHVPLRRWDPERIGPYAVLGRLGSGSMGQVYLGRSAAGRLVAVKTIRVELAEEAGFRTRFAQEVAAARKVSGVFTASVVEADPEADLPWLATAYVAAPSLSRLVLACGPLPADSVRWLAAGCAEALASIHGTGLVHRDLKPSNVLVAPDGPRVIDFGVARAAERMGRTTSRGAVGTPAYMAPEQARDTREASVASDVYSLGATLLFAATGHSPHSGASVMDVLARLATEEPDLSGLPGELTDLIAACLDRVPRNRPTSTAMLVQLGDFTVAQAGPDEDHPYLPDAAMALLTEYQRSPQFAAQARPGEEDSTSASYTELPASYKPRPRRPPKGAGAPGIPGSGPSGAGRKGWIRTHLAWAGWASVGAALIVAGVILGASLTSSSDPDTGPPAAPGSGCGSSAQGGGATYVCMNEKRGYPDTSFVVEGRGFSPRATLKVTVSEIDPVNNKVFSETSADQPVTGSDGTFQAPVAQLYHGALQLGLVTVSVTGPGGHSFDTQFMVIPPGAPLNRPPPG
jgi:serine/threonine protein kinase